MQQKGRSHAFRRTLAAILLALISATFLIPLAYAGDDPDASLPVCCRAHGAHRCSLGSTAHIAGPRERPDQPRDNTNPRSCLGQMSLPALLPGLHSHRQP